MARIYCPQPAREMGLFSSARKKQMDELIMATDSLKGN